MVKKAKKKETAFATVVALSIHSTLVHNSPRAPGTERSGFSLTLSATRLLNCLRTLAPSGQALDKTSEGKPAVAAAAASGTFEESGCEIDYGPPPNHQIVAADGFRTLPARARDLDGSARGNGLHFPGPKHTHTHANAGLDRRWCSDYNACL